MKQNVEQLRTRMNHKRKKHAMMDHASKRGRALIGKPFASHLADRDHASTVLSVLAGAHSVGRASSASSTRGRRARFGSCTSSFGRLPAVVLWADLGTRISRNVGGWRACSHARRRRTFSIVETYPSSAQCDRCADSVHFEGIHTPDMSKCYQWASGFTHLKGYTRFTASR